MNKLKHFFSSKISVQSVLLTLLACLIIIIGIRVEQSQDQGSYPIYQVAFLWILLLIFCLWIGNIILFKAVQYKLLKRLSFEKRFGLQLILTLLFSILYINVTYWIFKNRYTTLPPNEDQIILLNIYGILFFIPVLSVQFGVLFLQKWKKANLKQEHMKKEQIRSELITLKSHLSPHFMFNNLNILSSLIHTKNAKAQTFLDRFAEVYRYVLKNREAELVILNEELDFITSYIFLLAQRFQDELKIDLNISQKYRPYLIPPLALQMLIENALKHNIMTEDQPLFIKIFTGDSPVITVENSIALRHVPDYEKTGMGLDNIKRRYELISNQDITITKSKTSFLVVLPLIQPH